MPLQNAYPLFFALAGIAGSTLLLQRGIALLDANAKAALIDSSSSTRWLGLVAMGLFVVLLLWRPLVGWLFLGCAYLALGGRSFFRLRRLRLPPHAARLILAGNLCAVAGIALCAFIFAARALA